MSDPFQSVILSNAKDPSPFVGGVPPPRNSSIPPGSFALLRMTVSKVQSLPARTVSGLVWVYQLTVSPALVALNPACGCRFAPTCSHYAREALREHGLVLGLFFTFRRLVKCGPWHPGGIDPVPARRHPVCTKISAA